MTVILELIPFSNLVAYGIGIISYVSSN